MQQSNGNLHIFLVITENEMTSVLSETLERAGCKLSGDTSLDTLIQCIRDNPAVITPIKHEDNVSETLEDMVGAVRDLSHSATCVVITSKQLSQLEKGLKRFTWQPLKKLGNQKTLSELEKEHIITALESHGWQYKTVAKILGINRSTLYRKLKKYAIHKIQ